MQRLLSATDATSNAQILSTQVVHNHEMLSARCHSKRYTVEFASWFELEEDGVDRFAAIVSNALLSALKSTRNLSSPGSGPDKSVTCHSTNIVDEKLYTSPFRGAVIATFTVAVSDTAEDADVDCELEFEDELEVDECDESPELGEDSDAESELDDDDIANNDIGASLCCFLAAIRGVWKKIAASTAVLF